MFNLVLHSTTHIVNHRNVNVNVSCSNNLMLSIIVNLIFFHWFIILDIDRRCFAVNLFFSLMARADDPGQNCTTNQSTEKLHSPLEGKYPDVMDKEN